MEISQPIIVGGYTGSEFLDTIEAFDGDGWGIIGNLPTTVYQHGASPGNSEAFGLIGGIQGSEYSSSSGLFSAVLGWIDGPALNVARSRHSSGVFNSDSSFVFVVAGGFNGEYLKSTEFNEVESGTWTFGPDLPQALCCAGSFSNLDGFYVIGGHTAEGKFLDTIYHLKDINSEWVGLEQKLSTARDYPTTFGIKDDLTNCE